MGPIPDDIRRFIEDNIETVDQLEILRVLRESPDSTWEPDALALAADAVPANTSVAFLHARGLVSAVPTEAGTGYRYGPTAPELAATTERVLDFYRTRPVTLIRLIADFM